MSRFRRRESAAAIPRKEIYSMSVKKADQSDEFKRVARELECDEDEARFNEKLKRIARETPADKNKKSEPRKPRGSQKRK